MEGFGIADSVEKLACVEAGVGLNEAMEGVMNVMGERQGSKQGVGIRLVIAQGSAPKGVLT